MSFSLVRCVSCEDAEINQSQQRMAAASDEAHKLRIELDALSERLKLRDETELRSRLAKQKALYVQTVTTLKETMEDNRLLQAELLRLRETRKLMNQKRMVFLSLTDQSMQIHFEFS
ncbi:hypothetical protein EV359DRAFT_82309 [Lentinula novae-zelandiae]|nr:hypothetical protein EV359DRAFT_82309 [Lentinula novae-zelandiae]